METIGIDTGKLNLIRLIMDINNSATIEKIRSYVQGLTVVAPDETLLSKEEFFAKIDRAKESIERGEGKRIQTPLELQSFLNSL